MKAKFLRIDGSEYPQLAYAIMTPSFAKELASLVKRERDAAYSAGVKAMQAKAAKRNLPVGESSRAPEGTKQT